ncbi:T-complex protein 10A homolog 1 [Bubalus bubalis]|uniref:T-complex protein 10A homolog 1 n=1 Tax=Bubalus bubalis TaxID=89462 RepID=UPI001D1153A0|nr:T-complex protein 10A homolog 1 [Bubalus bubalis]
MGFSRRRLPLLQSTGPRVLSLRVFLDQELIQQPLHCKRLQQEVSGLREEFRKQEARWAATHRELRAQVDALVKQNLELRAGLRASERRRLEAKRSAAGSVHVRRHSEARVPGPLFASPEHHPHSRVLGAGVSESAFGKMSPLPADTGITPKHAGQSNSAALLGLPSGKLISRETEKTDSGKPIPCEDGDKALSRRLQDRHAKPRGRKQASEEKPAPSEDGKVLQQSPQSLQKWSGRRSPAPAALAVAPQDHGAKDDPDTCSSPSRSDASRLPALVPTDEPTCSSPSISEEPQDLPVEPELPPDASQHEDTKMKQEEEGEGQHPKDKGEQALSNSCKMDTFSKGTEKDVRADKTTTHDVPIGT